MKNITILHYTSFPIIAGVELVIKEQAILMKNDGHNVKIVAGIGADFDAKIKTEIIKEIDPRNPKYLKMRGVLDEGKIPENFEHYTDNLYQKLNASLQKTDILIIHQALTMHFNLALTCALIKWIEKNKSSKIIHWTHDATFLDQNYIKLYKKFQNQYPWSYLIRKNNGIKYVSISEERRNKIAQLFRISPSLIPIIPNGLIFDNFWNLDKKVKLLVKKHKLLDKDLVALLPMRIVRRKNIELAIKITHLLNEKLNFVLLITAPIDYQNPDASLYYKELKQLTKKLKIEDKVIFISEAFDIKNIDLKNLFAITDFLLVTSKLEGFGMPLIEAAATKTPIVCSDINVFREIAKDSALYINLDQNYEKTAIEILSYLKKIPTDRLFRRVINEYNLERIYQDKIKALLI